MKTTKQPLRIISYNINGIRAAIRKGFIEWLTQDPADIICLQELKADIGNIPITLLQSLGYEVFVLPAQKKGYSGVGILTRIPPQEVIYGQGITQSDIEGRVLQLRFANFYLINTYFPSGSSGDARQAYKMDFLEDYLHFTRQLIAQEKNVIIAGDYNICHQAIDIHDPIGNKNASGFLPEERVWMDDFFALGMHDSFRLCHPNQKDAYSWWSYRAAARERNKGWRIDYISVSSSLKEKIHTATLCPEIHHSDHCPAFLSLHIS